MRLILILLLALASCTQTIVPKPVAPKAVAFSEGVQDAGIKGYDATGLIVSEKWVLEYDNLLRFFSDRLPPSERVAPGSREGITRIGVSPYFHADFDVNERFAQMKQIERDGTP